jgi:hypothetical protein
MHFDVRGAVGLYGELAFAIVCTFWIWHELRELFRRKP